MKWYLIALKKYAVFKERSGRMEFWMFVLFSSIASNLISFLDNALNLNKICKWTDIGLLTILYSFAVFIPSLAIIVRRFHDIGKSGWMFIRFCIGMVLIMGALVFGWWYYTGANVPKGVGKYIFSFVYLLLELMIMFIAVRLILLLCKASEPYDNKWGPYPNAGELTEE